LAVDDAGRVEGGHAGDGDGFLGRVEVDYVLGGAFEGCCWGEGWVVSVLLCLRREVREGRGLGCGRTEDDGVGGKDGKVGIEFLVTVRLFAC
jgi:hypothetical protein